MNSPPDKEAQTLSLPLHRDEPHPCPYLPGLLAQDEFTLAARLDGRVYEMLMNRRFRRSGSVVYRPVCDGCRQCVALRVPVAQFRPSRSQRRVRRRNRDVSVEIGEPECSDEKWRIYSAYLRYQHDGTMSNRREDFEQFLYDSPTDTLEMVYRVGRRIVGAGIVDRCPGCLSSVYFYFDPADARRSLGIYSMLMEIDTCRRRSLPYWYAGYYVRDCKRMNYKANFHPHELLGPDGVWRPAGSDAP